MRARVAELFFFFNDTATTEIYTLSLHDALPISGARMGADDHDGPRRLRHAVPDRAQAVELGHLEVHGDDVGVVLRSEEHTSELQSQSNLVCRLLLEKKNGDPCRRNTERLPRPRP